MPPNDAQIPAQPQPAQSAPVQQPQVAPEVVPTKVNYAGAAFFTLLIVGFTFRLPIMLYVPVLFFCLVAGIMFFGDILTSRNKPSGAQPPAQPGAVYPAPAEGTPVLKPRYRKLGMAILIAYGIVQGLALLFVGFIALIIIALSSGGGFG